MELSEVIIVLSRPGEPGNIGAVCRAMKNMGLKRLRVAAPLLPLADKIGQIEMLTTYIRQNFGRKPQGCWLAHSLWEQSLVGVLNTCATGEIKKRFCALFPVLILPCGGVYFFISSR
jgi:hypothetical protein